MINVTSVDQLFEQLSDTSMTASEEATQLIYAIQRRILAGDRHMDAHTQQRLRPLHERQVSKLASWWTILPQAGLCAVQGGVGLGGTLLGATLDVKGYGEFLKSVAPGLNSASPALGAYTKSNSTRDDYGLTRVKEQEQKAMSSQRQHEQNDQQLQRQMQERESARSNAVSQITR